MKYTKDFKDITKKDTDIAGGKGASLGEMLNCGINVPDGYVVLSTTFDCFLKKTDLVQEIDSILDGVDHNLVHEVERASQDIQNLIISREIPLDIKDEITGSFGRLNASFVAVRSSATAEDGAENAWAGQLESYLNTSESNLLENVKKCWASLFTPRAIFYRFEKGLHKTKISVAVVIQKMVQSEISGIAFSVHPVTEDRNQIIIEAGLGLGEAIVSGSVTPDSYVVEKEPRRVLDVKVNEQNKALYMGKDGGVEWKTLTEEESKKQVLSNSQILEFSEIIIKIENHYGFPCDIEWAYEDEKFYVVQSRPITTLNKIDNKDNEEPSEEIEPKDGDLIEVDANNGVVRVLEKVGVNSNDKEKDVYKSIKHFLMDREIDVQSATGSIFNVSICYWAYVNSRNVHFGNFLKQSSFMVNGNQTSPMCDIEEISNITKLYYEDFLIEGKKFNNFIRLQNKAINNVVAIGKRQNKTNEDLLSLIDAIVFWWEYCLLGEDKGKYYEKDIQDLLSQNGFKTEDIKDILVSMSTPDKKSIFTKEREDFYNLCTKRIKNRKNSRGIKSYIEKYFYMDTSFYNRNIIDEKSLLLKIDNEIKDKNAEYFIKEINSIKNNNKEIKKLKRNLLKKFKFGKEELKRLNFSLIFSEWLNTRKENMMKTFFFMSDILHQISNEKSVEYEKLAKMTFKETKELISNSKSVNETELRRRNECLVYVSNDEFNFIYGKESSDLFNLVHRIEEKEKTNEVKGKTAYSSGYLITGIARVVINPLECPFGDGEILITSMTRIEFVPLMKKAKAIITDEGGISCHAAIISRELKIPCIVGTKFATQVLKDGDLIEVDADNGVVRILNKTNKNQELEGEIINRYKQVREDVLLKGEGDKRSMYFSYPGKVFYTDWIIRGYEKELRNNNSDFADMFVMNFVKDGKFHAEVVFNKFFEKTLGELRSDYKKFLKNDKDKLIKIEKKNEETIDRLSNCFKGGQDLTFYFKIIKELEELFIETNNHNEFSTIVELFLEDEIGKAFRDSNITKENILLLASSQEKSFFEIYNSKLEDLSNWVKKEKIDIGDFKTAIKKEKFLNKLRDAYKSGYFLKSSYAGVNFVGMEDIFEDLVHFKKNKIESYLNLKELYSSLSSKQKEIIEISRYYSQQRDKRKEIQQKTFYLQAQCIDEISKITSIHRSDLENLRPGQFSKKIFSDKNLLFNLIKDQKKGVFLLATDMGSFTKMGDAANLFFDDVKMKDTSVDKELYGVTACKGKAKGVVRLIHNLHEDYFFEPGDILVTGMTSPNFIPIMKKAGGIITDLGGATCHAAIISRELDVPCIIGTKRSTKVLKDGDLVEVDADNGVVKILEGKNN